MSDDDTQAANDDALLDLLVQGIGEPLTPAEQHALDVAGLGADSAQRQELERAAAALMLASVGRPQSLPELLRARLQRRADAHFAAAQGAAATAGVRTGSAAATAVRPAGGRDGLRLSLIHI